MSYVKNEAQFRFPLALQILFAILTFFGVLCLPESPRWVCYNPSKFPVTQLTHDSSSNMAMKARLARLSGHSSTTLVKSRWMIQW
jgi:hypothetical protein